MEISKIDKNRLPDIEYIDCNSNEKIVGYNETSNPQSPLYQVLKDDSINGKSIFLIADGGIGKSTTLRSLWLDSLCGNNNLNCIYVDLKLLDSRDGKNGIHTYVEEKLHIPLTVFKNRDASENPIILLDGANEAPEKLREETADNQPCFLVEECKELMKNFRVVISSRSEIITSKIMKDSEEKENRHPDDKKDFENGEIQYCNLLWLTDAFIESRFEEAKTNPALRNLLKNNMMFSMYEDLKAFGIEWPNDKKITAGKLLEFYFDICFKTKFIKDALNLPYDYKELYAKINAIKIKVEQNSTLQSSDERYISSKLQEYDKIYDYLVENAFKSKYEKADLEKAGILVVTLEHLSILTKNPDDKYVWANEIYQEFFQAKRLANVLKILLEFERKYEKKEALVDISSCLIPELESFSVFCNLKRRMFYETIKYAGEISEVRHSDINLLFKRKHITEVWEYKGLKTCEVGLDGFIRPTDDKSVHWLDSYDRIIVIMSVLTDNRFPKNIKYIDEDMFYNCKYLSRIEVPDNVVIERDAFACSSITSLIVNNNVLIRNGAFSNCQCLTHLEFSDYFINSKRRASICIAERAFNGCSSLTSITIPDSVTSIGSYAFEGCSSLTCITIPDSVTSIGDGAFEDCSSLLCNEYDNAYYLGNSTNPYVVLIKAKDRYITSCIINDNTKFIHSIAFEGCSSLTSITIGDSVTSIGEDAFEGCSSLTSITIPDSVTSIGDSAFWGCSITTASIPALAISSLPKNGLQTVVITSGEKIDNDAFTGCSSLTSITVDENNTSYASQDGILYNKQITEIKYVPNAIQGAVTIPYGVTSIGSGALRGCSSLTSITIPDSVTSIKQDAFKNCSSLTSITIPNSVTSIGSTAFKNCSSLTSITIPDSVTSIGEGAFSYCSNLTSITIPDSVTSIDALAFHNCRGLTSITIPDSVTSIGWGAFEGCSSLTSITIPDSVTSIGDWAFYDCKDLKTVFIPDSVKKMRRIVFSSVNIYCESPQKPKDWADYWCNSDATVHWGVSREEYDAIVKGEEKS